MSQANQSEPVINRESQFSRFLVILAAVCATGLFAISLTTFSTQPTSVSSFKKSSYSEEQVVVSVYSSLSKADKKSLFEDFKSQFGREYESDDEESERFSNFEDFLVLIDERNSAEISNGGSAIHGITKFSDMTEDEITTNWKGFKLKGELEDALKGAKNGDNYAAEHSTTFGATTEVNWAGTQTTPVKNQGYCGSCWAFSATEQIESDSIRAGYTNTSEALSPQQITSCATYDSYGCDGGLTIYAYYYVYKTGGLETNASYPYTSYMGGDGTCESNSNDYKITVDDYYYLSSETAMETHVLNYGPLSVCLDATTWPSYTNGTVTTCGTKVDHCVQAVGVNQDEGYWVIRNSWGTDWGMDGYLWLESGDDLCKITYIPTFVVPTQA